MENASNRRAADKIKEQWHVGKEIPIAMLFAIAIQTLGAVWWAATMNAKIDSLSYQVAALTADKYSAHDAERDQALVNEKIENIRKSVDQLKEDIKWQKRK